MHDYRKELETAKEAASEAAGVVRNFIGERGFTIDFKGKYDLVTDADLAAEKVVLEALREAFPDDRIMAEETAQEVVRPIGRTWFVDPIDGTTNFAHGFPVSCVSIGLWEDHLPRVGVVLEINHGECFSAVRGEGAWLDGQPISVSSVDLPGEALIGTGFPYNDLSLLEHYLKYFEWLIHRTQGVRRPGAAAWDLCCVASGRFDGFYEYSLSPWDVGAAALIVREAGGMVSDWEGGDNWLFSRRIVAGNSAIHTFLLDGITQHFTEEERRSG